jgi:hypothetical protein
MNGTPDTLSAMQRQLTCPSGSVKSQEREGNEDGQHAKLAQGDLRRFDLVCFEHARKFEVGEVWPRRPQKVLDGNARQAGVAENETLHLGKRRGYSLFSLTSESKSC